ncbi:MAG: dipeptidase [bacterium]|nr:MAG: dipeptidase [bacterium]
MIPFFRKFLLIFSLIILSVFSCRNQSDSDFLLDKQAKELAQQILILDSHIDVPYRLVEEYEDISTKTEKGQFDYPRAISGGLNVAFFAIYVWPALQEKGGARASAELQIEMVLSIIGKHSDKFKQLFSPQDLEGIIHPKMVNIVLGIENGAALEGKLENLSYFYQKGVRYITLTHAKSNQICDSSYDPERKWNGLSPFGMEVVQEMNRLGIMIDVSHVSDEAFYQVLELSRAPVIVSHSAARHFTPGFERNLDDEMIKMMAQKRGVIQVPFGSYFIHPELNRVAEEVQKTIDTFLLEHHLAEDDSLAQAFIEDIKSRNQVDQGDIDLLINQIDYIVNLAGVDYVGLGSDFDGIGKVPRGLEDVSAYPNIIKELLKKGYSESDIRKICGENFLRVWREIEMYPQTIHTETSVN